MEQSKIGNKIKGSLYGFVIGDAMGATTEFRDTGYIKKNYGVVSDIIGGGVFKLQAGKGTDDTQMTLCVCEAIKHANEKVKNNKEIFDELVLDRCCSNFVHWFVTDGLGCGRCCYESIMNNMYANSYKSWIKSNVEPETMPDKKRRLGNGSLMRTMPIILSGQSEDLAILQGRLTHNNIQCDTAISVYYNNMEKLLYENCFNNISDMLFEPTGHVINTLNNSLYHVQKTESFDEAIIQAVNNGGDADTIAAITGSLAGALYGYNAIPKRWIEQLDVDVKNQIDEYAKLFEKINKKVCTNS